MKRISIGPGILKVSRPGYNVDYATQDQLAFDAVNSRYGAHYLSGWTYIDNSWSTQTVYASPGSFNQGYIQFTRKIKTINLGKWFTQPPQVIYMLRDLNNSNSGAFPRYSYINTYTNGLVGTVFWASTNNYQLILRLDYPSWGSGSGLTNFHIGYSVFQT